MARADAAFVVIEDFEDEGLGNYPNAATGAGGETPTVVADDGTKFGSTSNQYARFYDSSGTGGGGIGHASFDFSDGVLASYSMDLIDVSGSRTIALSTTEPWSATRWVGQDFSASVPNNVVVKMTLLLNRSGSVQSFFDPVSSSNITLSDDAIALYYHDGTSYVQIVNNKAGDNSKPGPTRIFFYQGFDTGGQTLVDNIAKSTLLEVDAIPEPGTLVLAGLGGLLMLPRRKRGAVAAARA